MVSDDEQTLAVAPQTTKQQSHLTSIEKFLYKPISIGQQNLPMRNVHNGASFLMGDKLEQDDYEYEKVSVAEAVATAVDHIRSTCLKRDITIETDLEGVNVEADSVLVVQAAASLLTNAINAMPAGGVLSVTLVETGSQWELEVADSGRTPSRFNAPENTSTEPPEHPPVFIEFLTHHALQEVRALAQDFGGSMQTYPCPLGGSAHVLIIPKFSNSKFQNESRRAA